MEKILLQTVRKILKKYGNIPVKYEGKNKLRETFWRKYFIQWYRIQKKLDFFLLE